VSVAVEVVVGKEVGGITGVVIRDVVLGSGSGLGVFGEQADKSAIAVSQKIRLCRISFNLSLQERIYYVKFSISFHFEGLPVYLLYRIGSTSRLAASSATPLPLE
jgi:hypothetical protein